MKKGSIHFLLVGIFFMGSFLFVGDIFAGEITVSDPSPTGNILGIEGSRLRNGDITMNDIPIMIASIIEMLLALAGVVSGVALIYHAVRMQIASGITGDSSGVDKAKSGMKGALIGFVLAMTAWFLMARLISLISSA